MKLLSAFKDVTRSFTAQLMSSQSGESENELDQGKRCPPWGTFDASWLKGSFEKHEQSLKMTMLCYGHFRLAMLMCHTSLNSLLLQHPLHSSTLSALARTTGQFDVDVGTR